MEEETNYPPDRPVTSSPYPKEATILEAACKIGIDIPTLCHIDLKGTCIKNNPASCRICVVEVAGRRNLAPACATRCTEGMVVQTSTLRVMNARKVVAELILSDHPNDCLTCPKCGNCELQTLALRFNIRDHALQRRRTFSPQTGSDLVHCAQHGQVHLLPPLRECLQRRADRRRAGCHPPRIQHHHCPRLRQR